MRTVYVDGPEIFVEEFEVFLESGGATLVTDAKAADARIKVRGEQFKRRVLSVDPRTGKDREFELVYIVRYSATRRDGTVSILTRELRIVRDFVFDADAVVGMSRQVTVLRLEMRRDAAKAMVRQIETQLR